MKWYCEIVQDFDGTYYANMTDGGTDSSGVWHEPKMVEGLPVNVTYKQLCEGIRKVTGVSMVQRKYLKFKSMGRKKYAYVDATQHIPEGCGCCPTWEQTKKYPPNWD